jgi:hypothetical protein
VSGSWGSGPCFARRRVILIIKFDFNKNFKIKTNEIYKYKSIDDDMVIIL